MRKPDLTVNGYVLKDNQNSNSMLTSPGILFELHGFPTLSVPTALLNAAEVYRAGGVASLSKVIPYLANSNIDKDTELADLKALYDVNDPFLGKFESVTPAAINELREDLLKGTERGMQVAERLFNADLTSSVDLTKFVTGMNWEHLTKPPYSNSTVTLKMPAILASYLLHGRLASVEFTRMKEGYSTETTGFRNIQTGGWGRIITEEGNTVFLGKVLSVQQFVSVDDAGIFVCEITITLSNFMYPFIVSEYRRSNNPTIGTWGVDGAALNIFKSESDGKISKPADPILGGLYDNMLKQPLAVSLQDFIDKLGHYQVPRTLFKPDPAVSKNLEGGGNSSLLQRLGPMITVLDGSIDETTDTPYNLQSSDIDSLTQTGVVIPLKTYEPYLTSQVTSVWQMIRNIFQPDDELIELFPVLLPYIDIPKEMLMSAYRFRSANKKFKPDQDSLLTPAQEAEVESLIQKEVRTPAEDMRLAALFIADVLSDPPAATNIPVTDRKERIGRQLGCIPALIYRFKPLQPDFDGSASDLNSRFAPLIKQEGPTAHEKVFGNRSSESEKKSNIGYPYLDIDISMVKAQRLLWEDLNRVNMVFVSTNLRTPIDPIAETSYTPVLNYVDINRNGLRFQSRELPFLFKQGSNDAGLAAALAERLYYTVGEGHCYASGTVECTLINNPALVCGIWIRVKYGKSSTGPDRSLVGYLSRISHSIDIDQLTGMPNGSTTLYIERASYGGRVPRIEKAKSSVAPVIATPPEDESRQQVRPANIPQAEPARPAPTETTQPVQGVGSTQQPAEQTPEAPQASRKGGDKVSATTRKTGRDPGRASKTVSKTPAGFTKTDPATPGPKDKRKKPPASQRQRISRTTTTATELYEGTWPPNDGIFDDIFLHYDNPSIKPIKASEFNAQRGLITPPGTPVAFLDYLPFGSTPDTAFGQIWVRSGDTEIYRVVYEDGAVATFTPFYDQDNNLIGFYRDAFHRARIPYNPLLVFPNEADIYFDPEDQDPGITPRAN